MRKEAGTVSTEITEIKKRKPKKTNAQLKRSGVTESQLMRMKKVEKEPEKESVSNLGSVRRRDSSTTIKRHKINKNLSRDSEINIELDKNEQNTTATVASVSCRISRARQEPSLENDQEEKAEISSPLVIMTSLSW
jgi:hypothetical protein